MMNTILARKPAVAVILGSLSIGLFLIAWIWPRPAFPQDNPFELPPVTGGEEIIIDEDSVSWLLTNNSSDDLYIETIDITWPQESGNLRQITFNGRIYKGEVTAPTASFDASMLGKKKLRNLPKGKDRTLQIKFDAENSAATQNQFILSVSFDDGSKITLSEDDFFVGAGVLFTENVPVGISPVDGSRGIKTLIGNNTYLYLLTFGDSVEGLNIHSIPDATGANMEGAVGETFFKFQSESKEPIVIAIQSSQPLNEEVTACNPDKGVCIFPLLEKHSSEIYQMTLRPDYLYAFERGDQ